MPVSNEINNRIKMEAVRTDEAEVRTEKPGANRYFWLFKFLKYEENKTLKGDREWYYSTILYMKMKRDALNWAIAG